MKQYIIGWKLEQIKNVFLQNENSKCIIMTVQKHLKINATIKYNKIIKRNVNGIQVAKKRIECLINILLFMIKMDYIVAINNAIN